MAGPQCVFQTALAALAEDSALRGVVRPEAAVLFWDLAGLRLLWASPAAASLREALARDGEGLIDPALPAAAQLRALGQGLAPARGLRLERLRLDPSRLTPPVTCACRRVTLASGEEALMTAVVGPVPKLARAGPPRSSEPALAEGAPDKGDEGDPLVRLSGLGTVRFLWRMDADGRFTACSEGLADVVGRAGAAILGRSWREIGGDLVLDPTGAVEEHLAARGTWSVAGVLWRIGGTGQAVAVDLAGTPLFDGKAFQGYRGFGLCRTDRLSEWSAPPAPEPVPEPALGIPSPSPSPSSRPAPLRATDGDAPAADEPSRGRASLAAVPAPSPDARALEHRALPHLSDEERAAFREIARALGARFDETGEAPDPARASAEIVTVHPRSAQAQTLAILERLPVGLLVCRGETLLYANRALLDLAGAESMDVLAAHGVARLFPGRPPSLSADERPPLLLSTLRAGSLPVDVQLAPLRWEGNPAVVMAVRRLEEGDSLPRLRALELELRASEARLRELASVLDTAADGVIVLDEAGRILSLNRSAEALFGYDQKEVAGESLTILLASESHRPALDYLEGLRGSDVARLLNDGREVLGRVRQGGTIPLFMTAGRASEGRERKVCAVLRDITALKKAEAEFMAARRAAEEASAEKADFLAKVSHELRTPLNAIIGFAEVMMEERFGRLGNERYQDYLKHIHEAGRRVVRLVDDLLDLAKAQAGRMELSFVGVSLNEVVGECVGTLSQNAARERIVLRTSFAANLPPVLADRRSLHQIVLNVVSNAVKFTPAGGQVIVSTAATDRGEVVVRVRDTGAGMSEKEVEAALEPFRQIATARKGGGTGLGLPLTKALVEANRGLLHMASTPNEGTLVEIVFPPTRVLAR